jgi:hypothetical protein
VWFNVPIFEALIRISMYAFLILLLIIATRELERDSGPVPASQLHLSSLYEDDG